MKTFTILIGCLLCSVGYTTPELTADSPPGPMEEIVVTANRTEVLMARREARIEIWQGLSEGEREIRREILHRMYLHYGIRHETQSGIRS